jgi:hypothetical protein
MCVFLCRPSVSYQIPNPVVHHNQYIIECCVEASCSIAHTPLSGTTLTSCIVCKGMTPTQIQTKARSEGESQMLRMIESVCYQVHDHQSPYNRKCYEPVFTLYMVY